MSLKNLSSAKQLSGKRQLELSPLAILDIFAQASEAGLDQGYELGSWMNSFSSENCTEQWYAACLRHMTALQKGEHIDSVSGRPHAFHVAWNALIPALRVYYLDEYQESWLSKKLKEL